MNKNYDDWAPSGRRSLFDNKVGDLRNLHDLEAATSSYRQFIDSKTPPSASEIEAHAELLSLIDTEAALFSRAHFNHTLDYEVKRAQRYHRHLSICLVNLDNIGEVSARFGNNGYKYVVSSLARIFKDSLRGVDFPARFAKSAYVAILPETDASGVNVVAERIRKVFECTILAYERTELKIHCSLGCSCFPAHAKTPKELIDKAYQSLEIAQMRGGNMVYMLESGSGASSKSEEKEWRDRRGSNPRPPA